MNMSEYVFKKSLSERKLSFSKQQRSEPDEKAEKIIQPTKQRKAGHELPPARHSVASFRRSTPTHYTSKALAFPKESAYMYEKKLSKVQKTGMDRHFAMCNYPRIEYHETTGE